MSENCTDDYLFLKNASNYSAPPKHTLDESFDLAQLNHVPLDLPPPPGIDELTIEHFEQESTNPRKKKFKRSKKKRQHYNFSDAEEEEEDEDSVDFVIHQKSKNQKHKNISALSSDASTDDNLSVSI